MKGLNYVEYALASLAAESFDDAPEKELERRLLVRARSLGSRTSAKRFPVLLALIALGGATAAATVGGAWIDSWWFVVEVEGKPVSGLVTNGQPVVIPFETEGGGSGEVRVRRDLDAHGKQQTLIQIESQGRKSIEKEEFQESFLGAGWKRYPMAELEGTLSLYVSGQATLQIHEFFGQSLDGAGSRLLLLRQDGSKLPVIELARLPFDLLAPGSEVEFKEHPTGGLSILISNGSDAVMEFSWPLTAESQPEGNVNLSSFDGSVQVQVKKLPAAESSNQ